MENCYLSIIIPAYNAMATIRQCLESIENNNSTDYEIIVVDDGSTDDQNIIVKEFGERYGNVRLVEQNNVGSLGARLTGFKIARGKYVVAVDADDFVADDFVRTIYSITSENESADFILLNNYRNDTSPDEFGVERNINNQLMTDKSACLNMIWFQGEGAIWNKIYKSSKMKECLPKLMPYASIVYGDDLLLNTAYLSNESVKNIEIKDIAIYYHRREYGVTNVNKFTYRKYEDAISRCLCLGNDILGNGCFKYRNESDVFYWNIRYIIYQQLGLHKLGQYSDENIEKVLETQKNFRAISLKHMASKYFFSIFK